MAFDWFRRRYEQESEPATQAEPSAPPEVEAESPEPSQEPSPTAAAEDYLTWAKTAYQTLQKRQQAEVPSESAGMPPEPGTTGGEQPSIVSLEPTVETPTEAAIAPVPTLTAPSVSPGTESACVETVIPAAQPVQPSPISAETASFWEQAEAARLERLERLRQSAIAPPAIPESTPVAPPIAPSPLPDLSLDEGFLWSAEILAAQGRSPEDISPEEITWLNRLRQGLDKTRRGLVNQLRAIVGQGPLTEDAVLEIETALLQADVGVAATDIIIAALQNKLRSQVLPPDAAIRYLKQLLQEMLDVPLGNQQNVVFAPQKDVLNIWLMTGVNGAGKTTTIGKLAHIAQKSGYRCLIAAADTFRAAAVEQVKVWGRRSDVDVIANPGQNTDPAAVVFDAIAAAQSRQTELLLVDTAGRLQNKKNLMDELSKVRRIIDKKAPEAVVESLLVLDATLGQNGLRQAEVFSQAARLSGVVLTKLDGTAKGGIALAIVQQLGLPIRFIGAGEGIEDLRPFSSYEFVEALLNG